jgi:propanol-preferring alcohol dehydrogenase
VPEVAYEKHRWERALVSVANVTRRDVAELLELAARIPIRTQVERFPLAAANEALARLAEGGISGAAVLDAGVR